MVSDTGKRILILGETNIIRHNNCFYCKLLFFKP
jgi:hypothetical protein